jgi:hypothetical protein
VPARLRLLLVVAGMLSLAGCGVQAPRPHVARAQPLVMARQAGLALPARVRGGRLEVASRDGFSPRFWPGVNLGATVPGHAPGELAPARADFDRWFEGMRALGVRVVRVYTIQRPVFYDALAAHNAAHPDTPLYFVQGVWIPEAEFLRTRDAYAPAVTAGFDRELADAVAVVHGDATLAAHAGHASGSYRADVARWLLAWSPGVEWDPASTAATDRRNRSAARFRGRYVTATRTATPMESWLAARLDHLASLEAERGWSHPMTFTNWLSTDPLEHPAEPLAEEDLVSVDALHLRATAAWPGGFFASYHAYPYYPDFLRLEPRYRRARSPYAAYLRELRAHHRGQAVMITEFGVPTGLGIAHRGPRGRDQGDHSEQEAGAIDAAMLREIRAAGFAGGFLFEWTDEWFKRSWNTVELAPDEDRRPRWFNVLTNETQFGVVAVEPGGSPGVTVDGYAREWRDTSPLPQGTPALLARHDGGYLYLLLHRAGPAATVQIGLDVRAGSNGGLPGRPGVAPEADVALTIGPGDRARIERAASADPISVHARTAARGAWVQPQLLLDRARVDSSSGVRGAAELAGLGTLRWGTADPGAAGFDGRVLAAGDGATVELRIPWMLLGYSDPSSQLLFEPHADGSIGTSPGGPIGLTLAARGEPAIAAGSYAWRRWDDVEWHERRKAGWPALARAFAAAAR